MAAMMASSGWLCMQASTASWGDEALPQPRADVVWNHAANDAFAVCVSLVAVPDSAIYPATMGSSAHAKV